MGHRRKDGDSTSDSVNYTRSLLAKGRCVSLRVSGVGLRRAGFLHTSFSSTEVEKKVDSNDQMLEPEVRGGQSDCHGEAEGDRRKVEMAFCSCAELALNRKVM